MKLGISTEAVIEAKFGAYLNTLSPEQRKKKLEEYKQAAGDSIEATISEAEALADSIQSTVGNIATFVPNTIAQVASLVTMVDPTAKAAQLITIKESISSNKDNLNRANAQLQSLNNIVGQLGIDVPALKVLKPSISSAISLLDTIPV